METLRYKLIKSTQQYKDYCEVLESLITSGESKADEIELLTHLIETWDQQQATLSDADPIALLTSLMREKSLKAKDLTEILGVSKGLVSDILHYKKGLSKEIIRALSNYFKLSQEAFNRPYPLTVAVNRHKKPVGVIHSPKALPVG